MTVIAWPRRSHWSFHYMQRILYDIFLPASRSRESYALWICTMPFSSSLLFWCMIDSTFQEVPFSRLSCAGDIITRPVWTWNPHQTFFVPRLRMIAVSAPKLLDRPSRRAILFPSYAYELKNSHFFWLMGYKEKEKIWDLSRRTCRSIGAFKGQRARRHAIDRGHSGMRSFLSPHYWCCCQNRTPLFGLIRSSIEVDAVTAVTPGCHDFLRHKRPPIPII